MPKKTRTDCHFVEDILAAIGKIESYVGGMDFEIFDANDMAKDAIIRNFEVIGEAARNVSDEMRSKYPFVEWKEMTSFRNVLIHGYFDLSGETIWDTVTKKPLLCLQYLLRFKRSFLCWEKRVQGIE